MSSVPLLRRFWLGNHTIVRLDGPKEGEIVPVDSEAAIFELLGLPFHRPEDRCA
jgi:hypothetical protein